GWWLRWFRWSLVTPSVLWWVVPGLVGRGHGFGVRDQSVGVHESFDRREVHGQAVLLVEFDEQVGPVGTVLLEKGREFDEVVFEAGGRDDLQQPRWLVRCVPERMPDIARLVDQVPGFSVDHVVAELEAPASFEDE